MFVMSGSTCIFFKIVFVLSVCSELKKMIDCKWKFDFGDSRVQRRSQDLFIYVSGEKVARLEGSPSYPGVEVEGGATLGEPTYIYRC